MISGNRCVCLLSISESPTSITCHSLILLILVQTQLALIPALMKCLLLVAVILMLTKTKNRKWKIALYACFLSIKKEVKFTKNLWDLCLGTSVSADVCCKLHMQEWELSWGSCASSSLDLFMCSQCEWTCNSHLKSSHVCNSFLCGISFCQVT